MAQDIGRVGSIRMLAGRQWTVEILVPEQLDFIRAFWVHAWVNRTENAAVTRVEPACRDVDILRLDFQVPTGIRHRPSLGGRE
jgi:hypothetical protein